MGDGVDFFHQNCLFTEKKKVPARVGGRGAHSLGNKVGCNCTSKRGRELAVKTLGAGWPKKRKRSLKGSADPQVHAEGSRKTSPGRAPKNSKFDPSL